MKKTLAIILCTLLAVGCSIRQRYIEGTHLALGAYLPFEDAIYGVELLQYTSGAYLTSQTNTAMKYEREYAATNSYFWGMVETREWSKSKVGGQEPSIH